MCQPPGGLFGVHLPLGERAGSAMEDVRDQGREGAVASAGIRMPSDALESWPPETRDEAMTETGDSHN